MRNLMIAATAALCVSTHSLAEEVVFYVGQSHNGWAFNVTGKGRALVGKTLIYSDYEYIKVTNNPKHNKDKTIKYIEIDYAFDRAEGGWEIVRTGTRQNVNRTLAPGDWMTFNKLGTKLELKDKSAAHYWLVVTIGTDTGTVHAHSRKDIFE